MQGETGVRQRRLLDISFNINIIAAVAVTMPAHGSLKLVCVADVLLEAPISDTDALPTTPLI